MSLSRREIDNLTLDLRKILGFTTTGGVAWPNVVLAQRHAIDWQSPSMPIHDEERGGSSSPREVTERAEDRRVAHQALHDENALASLIPALEQELVIAAWSGAPTKELASVARNLALVVTRCVGVIDHTKLPTDAPPGCRSCARLGRTKTNPGYFEPLSEQERYAKKGLCTWCGRHSTARGWPPVEAVDVRVRQGVMAAARWLARTAPRAKNRRTQDPASTA